MKLITAIIQENRLDQVREALMDAEIERITVTRCSGHGQQVQKEIYRGRLIIPNLTPKIKLEIAVNEGYVETTVNTIMASARSGQDGAGEVGDGKIFITNLEECIRIRTGERGSEAI